MALVSALLTRKNLQAARLDWVQAQPAFAGEDAVFALGLRASRPCWALALRLGSSESVLADIAPGRETRVRIPVPAPRRGLLRPGRLALASEFPFGLFRSEATVTVDAECVVYPAPWDGPLDPAFGMARDAAEGDQIEGPGADDFSGLDAYAPGDDRRRIAWKASSRGQGLMTKAFHGLYGQTLLLDWDRLGPGPAEEKLSRLCAMVIQASGRNTDYGLRLGPTRIEPGRGEVHKHTCLAALALSPEGLGP